MVLSANASRSKTQPGGLVSSEEMLGEEREQALTEPERDQLDRIAGALESVADGLGELPQEIADAQRSTGLADAALGELRARFERDELERKAKQASRRANIAIALAGITALASLIAAIATLFHG